jgi:hypothetical protein
MYNRFSKKPVHCSMYYDKHYRSNNCKYVEARRPLQSATRVGLAASAITNNQLCCRVYLMRSLPCSMHSWSSISHYYDYRKLARKGIPQTRRWLEWAWAWSSDCLLALHRLWIDIMYLIDGLGGLDELSSSVQQLNILKNFYRSHFGEPPTIATSQSSER